MNSYELRDERAIELDLIDQIIGTAKEAGRDLTAEEERRHDASVAVVERLSAIIDRDTDSITRARNTGRVPVPDIPLSNRNPSGAIARAHTLDELLWATPERTASGTISRAGGFMPDPTGTTNPVEQVIVRSEGTLVEAPRLTAIAADDRAMVQRFQTTVADMVLFGLMVDKHARTSADGFEVARSHKLMEGRWHDITRALDVDTAGTGQAWVPTGIGAEMHAKVRAVGRVAPLFARIDLPTNPWKWPIEGSDSTAYRVAEPTSDTATKMAASTPGTLGATFDAEIFGSRTLFSRSVEADSAVAILNFTRGKIIQAHVDAEEMAILDGDTDGTHQDTDVDALGTTDARWAWDGLRKKALAQTAADASNAALSSALLRTTQRAMGKWGVSPSDLVHIVSISAYYDLLADTNLLTVDKFGPQATILTGQIGAIGGVPVVVSEHMREDLNASGVHDGITETRTAAITVNRGEWAIGQRMALDVEVDDSIYRETYQRVVVAFQRQDFQAIGDAATNDDTAITYNLAVS